MDSFTLVEVPSCRRNLHLSVLPKKDKSDIQIAENINQNCQEQRGVLFIVQDDKTLSVLHMS